MKRFEVRAVGVGAVVVGAEVGVVAEAVAVEAVEVAAAVARVVGVVVVAAVSAPGFRGIPGLRCGPRRHGRRRSSA